MRGDLDSAGHRNDLHRLGGGGKKGARQAWKNGGDSRDPVHVSQQADSTVFAGGDHKTAPPELEI